MVRVCISTGTKAKAQNVHLTLKEPRGGGRNPPTATLKACRVVWEGVRGIKPSCNFHFGCLEQVNDIKFGGCI